MSTAKEHLTKLIQDQPDDSSETDIVRELAFDVMVRRGLTDARANRTISNEEMGRRIRSWQSSAGGSLAATGRTRSMPPNRALH